MQKKQNLKNNNPKSVTKTRSRQTNIVKQDNNLTNNLINNPLKSTKTN